MAAQRVLQLLRSTQIYADFSAAETAIRGITGKKDGEIVLARYISGTTTQGDNTYETAIGVYSSVTYSSNTMDRWTVFKSSTEIEAALRALQAELGATQAGAGLGTDGSYAPPTTGQTGFEVLGGDNAPANLKDAIMKLADEIAGMDHTNNYTAATTGDTPVPAHATDASKVISGVNQVNGKLDTVTTDAVDLLLTGYQKGEQTGAIAPTDTVKGAFTKLENATAAGVKISEKAGNQITRIENDATAANNGLYSHVEIAKLTPEEVTALNDSNVREAYKLINPTDRTNIGNVIKIYKDSSLVEAYLGHVDDSLTQPASGAAYDHDTNISDGTGSEALCFVYYLADGTYSLVAVDLESFLNENEFGDGLQVNNHVVSAKLADGLELTNTGTSPEAIKVKKDDSSEKVYTAAAGTTGQPADVLTVGANGVKVANVQAAINYATQQVLSTTVASSEEALSGNTKHISISQTGPDATTGLYNYAVSETDIASEDLVNTITGQTLGSAYATSGQYIGKQATNNITTDLTALDTAVQNTLDGVVGSNAIAVGDKTAVNAAENPKTQTISLILDDSTVGNGQESTGNNNALSVTSDGLFLSNVWDCGQY